MSGGAHSPQPFADALRRIVTGESADGRSRIVLDGPPGLTIGGPRRGALYELWTESLADPLDPALLDDRSSETPTLSPAQGYVKTRWFVVDPIPDGVPPEKLIRSSRDHFRMLNAEHEVRDQRRHPAMHQTATLDFVVLISGAASLVLDEAETRLSPGQVVVQRGASHAWVAHGGPALFLAVLIGRATADTAQSGNVL